MIDLITEQNLEKISKNALLKASKIALELKKKTMEVKYKNKGQPVTEADIKIDQYLKDFFKRKTPNFGWLSEETSDDGSRFKNEFFWCLDPIDGTRSFINNKPEYTISLALIKNNIPILGFVVNPETREFFFAKKNKGAFCNDKKIKVNKKKRIELCKYAISNSEISKLSELKFIEKKNIIKMGSIAYKIALVAKGEIDIAISFTKKNDWDIAAADLILQEAGGNINEINGKLVQYNTPDLKIKSILASNREILTELGCKLSHKKIH